jgi:2-polyprenyl-6-hydroxyphenyl methylase/3-demethylubiquinone-9 3-methyltransferase
MELCRFSSKYCHDKLTKVFPEYAQFFEKEIVEVKKLINKNSVILDVGCGFGREIKELSPFCKKIIGIDADPEEIKTAKSYLKDVKNKELYIQNAKKTIFSDESFDVVICLGNTFGNFDNDKSAILEEMKRLTKKNGKIIIGVNNMESIQKKVKAFENIGLKIKKVENKKITLDTGIVSEEFSKNELKNIFEGFQLKAKFMDVNPIGILCIILKI